MPLEKKVKDHILRVLRNSIFRKSVGLSLVSALANILGFFIPLIIAYYFGVSNYTDKFFLAYGIVTYGASIFGSAVSSVMVPFVVERKNNRKALLEFINSTFIFLGLSALTLIAFGYIALHGLAQKTLDPILVQYLSYIIPLVFFLVTNSIARGVLNSIEHFYSAALSPVVRVISVCLSIFLFHRTLGIICLFVGYLFGELIRAIYFSIILRKALNFSISFHNVKWRDFSEFLKKGSQQIIGSIAVGSSPLIDKFVAAFLVVGSISMLDYGQKLFAGFSFILNSFLIVVLTYWSNKFIEGKSIHASLKKILFYIFGISLLISFIFVSFSQTLINFIYFSLSKEHISVIIDIFRVNMIAFIFIAMMQVLNRAAIACKFTRLIMIVAVIKAFLNIIFDLIFAYFYNVRGIAIASLFNHAIGFIIMYYFLKNELKKYEQKAKLSDEWKRLDSADDIYSGQFTS